MQRRNGPYKGDSRTVNFHCPEELFQRVMELREPGKSKSDLFREVLKKGIETINDKKKVA